MKAYNFDVVSLTLTLSTAFCKAIMNPESDEYKLYHRLMKEHPSIVVKKRTHNTPVKYRNSNGTVTKFNQFKGLSYKRMESFLNALPDNQEYKEIKETYFMLKVKAKAMRTSPYSIVGRWFLAQFPKYKDNPLYYLKNTVEAIDYAAFLDTAA